MRVVHFVESFSPLTETFVYDLIIAGQRRGLDSRVLTLRRESAADRPFDNLHEISLPPRWSPERIWSRLAVQVGRIDPDLQYSEMLRRRINRFLEVSRPDVIHAHFGPAGYLVSPVAQALGIPLAVSFYGYDVTKLPGNESWRRRYGQMFKRVDVLIALSHAMLEQLHRLGGPRSKLRIVHLAKHLADYPYRVPTTPVQHWISVGRLAEKKGHFDCINAFEAATRDGNATLTIVGDGELRAALTDMVRTRRLEQRVAFTGSLPHHQVIERLRRADAFVLCSKTASDGDTEGTPVVLLEAQALGLPCVATRHSAIPEVIPDENHRFLAEEGNVPDIAARMALLSQASQEELVSVSRAGRHMVEQEHSVEKEVARLLEIYSSIASRGKRGTGPTA